MKQARSVAQICRAYLNNEFVGVVKAGGSVVPLQDYLKDINIMIGTGEPVRKKIDVGKMMALYNAKWPVDEIAKELNVTRASVYRRIRKELEKNENR